MKHYEASVQTESGTVINLTVKSPNERLALASVKRKDSIFRVLSITECEAPVSMAAANKRFWVVLAKNMAGNFIEIFVSASSQANVRTKMEMHSQCACIIRMDETCESDWLKRKNAQKTLA
jgi:hypothetical protein